VSLSKNRKSGLNLSADRQENEAERQRPDTTVCQDFKGAGFMKILPIKRKKSPKRVSADAINEACCVMTAIFNSRSPIIRELNGELPLCLFYHRDGTLKIVATLARDTEFIALNLSLDGFWTFIT
jgi:hypothetical protein